MFVLKSIFVVRIKQIVKSCYFDEHSRNHQKAGTGTGKTYLTFVEPKSLFLPF